MEDFDFTNYFAPVWALVGLRVPTPAELPAMMPGLRKKWIREHYTRLDRLGKAPAEERPFYGELCKCLLRMVKCVSHQLHMCLCICAVCVCLCVRFCVSTLKHLCVIIRGLTPLSFLPT